MAELSPFAVAVMTELKRRVARRERTSALAIGDACRRAVPAAPRGWINKALLELVTANLIRFGGSSYYLTELGKGWGG